MAGVSLQGRVVRVKALQPSRRRAGLAFSPTPRDLTADDLGEGLAGFMRLIMICEDQALKVQLVTITDGDEEILNVGEAEIAELRAAFEAESARVDPANPPAPITELQTLGGSTPEAESAAAPTADGGEKAPDSTAAGAADPAKADEASAASTEQAREQAGDAAADQKAASTEEHQPGATVPAPVAEPDKPATADKTAKPKRQAKDSAGR